MISDSDLEQIAQAIFTVNRHAKTAPEPQHLYFIKKEAINKLLREKRAEKIGLHFSERPKYSNQHSTLLIKVSDYYFHIPPSKEDFKELEHLGTPDNNYRNPSSKMSLSQAKRVLYPFIDYKPAHKPNRNKTYQSSYYTPSSLGKIDWSKRKSSKYY
jgi:hypothetical protein